MPTHSSLDKKMKWIGGNCFLAATSAELPVFLAAYSAFPAGFPAYFCM
jgi:hypothetical protein